MNHSARHDLSYISFVGKTPPRRRLFSASGTLGLSAGDCRGLAFGLGTEGDTSCAVADGTPPASGYPESAAFLAGPRTPSDDFIAWVLGLAGLDAAAYRAGPLARRLPACLRTLKVGSTAAARELLERRPELVTKAVSSLLIGVTEFFREPEVFDLLRTQVLPALAERKPRLRIWSAACSSGAELYSVAILLSELGLLERSFLLGTDCRGDAIERRREGLYDAAMLRPVPCAVREKYFQPAGRHWRPIEALRRQAQWKTADLLSAVEAGPWDVIFWRNTAIYLEPHAADATWRRLASVLDPQGVLIAGKADHPPHDAGLAHAARRIYRRAA